MTGGTRGAVGDRQPVRPGAVQFQDGAAQHVLAGLVGGREELETERRTAGVGQQLGDAGLLPVGLGGAVQGHDASQ